MAFPVSEDKIIEAETALGRRLPDYLRSRLQKLNGGEIALADDIWMLHPVRDNSDRKRLSRTSNDIILETKTARGWRHFPTDGIALASNGCGDRLVLVSESDDINFWDHETGTLSPIIVEWS